MNNVHWGKGQKLRCHYCDTFHSDENELLKHFEEFHPPSSFKMVNSALNGCVVFFTKLLHLFIGVEDLMSHHYINEVKGLIDQNLQVFLSVYYL